MALSTFKLVRSEPLTRRLWARWYVAVPSATGGQGYNNTNGQVFDFTLATNPSVLERPRPPANPLPTEDDIAILKMPLGFTCEIKRATSSPTLKNFVLRIFNANTTGNGELATADYPAGIAGKDIVFSVVSKKQHG